MIIDFNRYNGGSGSGSTDLRGYWNSAVTEQHIESASSIVYGSATSYTDQALEDIDLSEYWTSAQTEEHIESASSIVYASAASYTDQAVAGIDLSDYYTSAQTESAITMAVSGKADAQNVTAGNGIPFWNAQGIITGKKSDAIGSVLTINNTSATALTRNSFPGGSFATIFAPTTSGETGQILMASGNTPVWIDNNFVTSADVKSQVEAYEYVTSAQVETQIESKGYTAGPNINISPANVISVSGLSTINGSAITGGGNLVIEGGSSEMDELKPVSELPQTAETGAVVAINNPFDEEIGLYQKEGDNKWVSFTKSSDNSIKDIVTLPQSDYDALVAQSETVPTTLYIVIPDNI